LQRCREDQGYYTLDSQYYVMTSLCVMGRSDEGTFANLFRNYIRIDGQIEYECDGVITLIIV